MVTIYTLWSTSFIRFILLEAEKAPGTNTRNTRENVHLAVVWDRIWALQSMLKRCALCTTYLIIKKLKLINITILKIFLRKFYRPVCYPRNWNLRHKTIILPVVLYGYETWSLTLWEEHRLRVFENKVLRMISGAKKDEITGEWRKLHDAELLRYILLLA